MGGVVISDTRYLVTHLSLLFLVRHLLGSCTLHLPPQSYGLLPIPLSREFASFIKPTGVGRSANPGGSFNRSHMATLFSHWDSQVTGHNLVLSATILNPYEHSSPRYCYHAAFTVSLAVIYSTLVAVFRFQLHTRQSLFRVIQVLLCEF
jgi:hypothetical protein